MARSKEAEAAYQAAVEEIEKARKDGWTTLDLNEPSFRTLDEIPPEIAGLTKLERLVLWRTQVNDLTPLAAMTGLTALDLTSTQVSDLTPLATMTGLTTLDLRNTQVSDLTPLAARTGLTTLYLSGTQVSDLTSLAAMTGLTSLYLSSMQVSDFTPLAAMTGLTTLDLSGTQVSDLTPLAAMTGLATLDLSSTQVSDLTPLAALTGLSTLDLSGTQVSNLTPLAAMTGLTKLDLRDTQVSDLTPLAAMTGLTTLDLMNTQVSDLTPLAAMTGLTTLNLRDTQVSDLRLIRDFSFKVSQFEMGLTFANTPATAKDPELARLAAIADHANRTAQTLAYLKTLPPWPEPLAWLGDDGRPESPSALVDRLSDENLPLAPSAVPGRGLIPPAGLRRLTLSDARAILEKGHPILRDRCQCVVAEIEDALAIQSVRIPNDPDLLNAHEAITRSLILSKAALVGIHEALPEDFTDQPIDEIAAGRLRAAFDNALQRLKDAAVYIDRKDHSPTYGGLLKIGAATGVASVLAIVPGVGLAAAIPAVFACLYGPEAAKALKDIGKLGGTP